MAEAAEESNRLTHETSDTFGDSGTFVHGVPRTKKLKNTIFGKRQDLGDIKLGEWIFMGFGVVATLVMLGFSIHRIVVLESSKNHDPISPEIVMVIAEVFAIYYICHGVLYERYQEIAIYFLAIFCDNAYCTYEFFYKEDFSFYPIFRLGWDWSMGLVFPFVIMLILTLFSKKNFYVDHNRLVYRFDGREDIQRDLKCLFWLNSLLVLDLQFALCSVVFIVTERHVDLEDGVVLGLGSIVNLVFFIAGKCDIRRERHRGTFIFLTLGSFPLFFLLFKIAKQIDCLRTGFYLDVASILFGSLSLFVRGVILVLSYLIIARYGSGLKKRIFEEPEIQKLPETHGEEDIPCKPMTSDLLPCAEDSTYL